MRIAPPLASAAGPGTPAAAFIAQAAWLVRPGSVVTGLVQVDATTVRMFVADPFVADPHGRAEADRLVADSALSVLDQAAHGVRLIPTTSRWYEGRLRELAPAQLTFMTGLPGVQRYDLVPHDVDGDGIVAPDEVAHRIEVDTPQDAQRLDWLLQDRFDRGSVQDGPVQVVVPERPWMLAPVSGS